jgi:predicted transcriptional regulator
MYKIKVCAQMQQLENEMLIYRKYESRYRITEKGLRFLRLYGELRQMISSKQKDRIREQDTFDSYRWPFQIATFTNPFWVR